MIDQNSEIIDFYPKLFKTDIKGKIYDWLGTVKLPFVERKRIIESFEKIKS